MIPKPLRERMIFAAMSVFLAWHTAAMLFAPAPDNSVIALALRPVFQPYLSLLRQDNTWDFFAPTVDPGTNLRYTLEDAAGNRQTFVPTQELSWYHPKYFWYRSWYYAVIAEPDIYAEGLAALFCRQHAALHPVTIEFTKDEQLFFAAEDYSSGKLPTDSEFITETDIDRVKCPAS
jgi:hypothetical protein